MLAPLFTALKTVPPQLARRAPNVRVLRPFTTLARLAERPLPPRPKVNENDLEEAFLKGTGPGGQKINKTNSAVQVKHIPTGLIVKCQETRSRSQNRKIARNLLSEKLDIMEKGSESRSALKAEKAKKKKASTSKKTRRKYRKLGGKSTNGETRETAKAQNLEKYVNEMGEQASENT